MKLCTRQLVRDASGKQLWTVANDDHRDPLEFDDANTGAFVPRWGSVSLLRLAIQAQKDALVPVGVVVRDRAGDPLPLEVDQDFQLHIVDTLRRGDLSRAQDCLLGDLGPYVVVAVCLMAPDGTDLRVGRLGGFDVTLDGSIDGFLSSARALLRDCR